MPKFTINVTRDITETAAVEVEAENFEHACGTALLLARNGLPDGTEWVLDDNGTNLSPYIADNDPAAHECSESTSKVFSVDFMLGATAYVTAINEDAAVASFRDIIGNMKGIEVSDHDLDIVGSSDVTLSGTFTSHGFIATHVTDDCLQESNPT